MPRNQKDWQALPFEHLDDKKLGWIREAIEDGNRWVQDQCATKDIAAGIAILSGKGDNPYTTWKNAANYNLTTGDLKTDVKDVIETLSNIRPFWGYQTDNKAFLAQANLMNKVTKSIYLKCFVDRSLRDALQFAALTGGGFLNPGYTRAMYGRGKAQFTFEPLGQPDVLPVQLPRDRDYQQAYVVTISKFLPVAKAHAMFPAYQDKLKPFAKSRYLRGGEQRAQLRANRWRMHSIDTIVEQYCEVFYSYILDLRVNDTGLRLPMGEAGTSWFYEVPSIGDEITRWEDGREVTRPANEDDCRVYPFRRLEISCDAALMYDGPGFDQHGMVPVVPFYLDDWAWEGTGYSLFNGTASIQYAMDALEASILRIAMARANPGKSYNSDVMSKDARLSSRQAEALDPFDPNITIAMDGDIKEPALRPPMPEWCYNIPEWVTGTSDRLRDTLKRSLGLDQIQALQKLRANIQQPEKLLESEGPVMIGSSRSMERSFRDLGEMTKFNVLQYLSTAEAIRIVGFDQIPPETLDMEADSLVPSHLPGEPTTDALGSPSTSRFSRAERARHLAENMEFNITPHSLHEIAQRERRLNILALLGKGVPVDPETLANEFGIPNWGSLEGSTIKEKVVAYAKEQAIAKAEIMKLEQGLVLSLGIIPPEPGGGGASHGATGKPEGRPNTYKKNPQVKQKGTASGGRAVLSTSG